MSFINTLILIFKCTVFGWLYSYNSTARCIINHYLQRTVRYPYTCIYSLLVNIIIFWEKGQKLKSIYLPKIIRRNLLRCVGSIRNVSVFLFARRISIRNIESRVPAISMNELQKHVLESYPPPTDDDDKPTVIQFQFIVDQNMFNSQTLFRIIFRLRWFTVKCASYISNFPSTTVSYMVRNMSDFFCFSLAV